MRDVGRNLAASTRWVFGGFAVMAAIGLGVNSILSRALTPQDLGIYFLAWSLVSSAATVGRVGLNQAVIRLLARSAVDDAAHSTAGVLRAVLRIAVVAAALSAIAFALGLMPWLAVSVFDSPRLADLGLLLGCWCFVEAVRLVAAEALRGLGDIRGATVLGDPGRQVLFAVGVGLTLVVRGRLTLAGVAAAAILAGAAAFLGAVLLLRRSLHVGGLRRPGPSAQSVLRVSAPIMVTALSLLAINQGDLWIAGAFLSDSEVGVYAASARLVLLVVFPLHICNAVLTPVIARLFAQGHLRELERAMRVSASAAAAPTLVIVGALVLSGGPILGLVYGDFYQRGATILALLACGQLVNALAGGCGQALLMTGHQRSMMMVTTVSGALFLVVGAVAARVFGATGLAAASAATTALSNVVLLALVRRKVGVWTLATVDRKTLFVEHGAQG